MTPLARFLIPQFDAALRMLHDCIAACPPDHWDSPIAKYPFWLVAYHTLCFADLYLSPNEASWQPSPVLHPRGIAELNDEYPSRRFTQPELRSYCEFCRAKAPASLAAETPASLDGPSGFPRYPICRAEFHINNIRHIQHHTGQLSASLRRVGVDTRWAGTAG